MFLVDRTGLGNWREFGLYLFRDGLNVVGNRHITEVEI